MIRKAIVVGVVVGQTSLEDVQEDLNELADLLRTLGYTCVEKVLQKRQSLVASSLLGSGKIEEIRLSTIELCAELVVFDHELAGVQQRNLEKMLGCAVLDRSSVILEIFSEHARTNQAKLQVEIATLEYLLPRLTGAWTHFQRQKGGGAQSRGMGEKQIEVDRRAARDRIARLTRQLEQFKKDQRVQSRARSGELKVALIGYTNSGKTSLMKSLTRSEIGGKDELFATLDASVKVIDPRTRPKILLSDTVGFIRNLPHGLIESFKSTLDQLSEADLLLHVVDMSRDNYERHMETTEGVLNEIGAGQVPRLLVFNKKDLSPTTMRHRILARAYPGSICVSALSAADVTLLRDYIYNFFDTQMIEGDLCLDPLDHESISLVHKHCRILNSDYENQDRVCFRIRTTKSLFGRIEKKAISEKNEGELLVKY